MTDSRTRVLARFVPDCLVLFQHALAPMADLPVLEVISASHILTDLNLSPAQVVFDYLAEEPVEGKVHASATAT